MLIILLIFFATVAHAQTCCERTDVVVATPVFPSFTPCTYRGVDESTYTEGLICPTASSPQTLVDGNTYQLRNLFFNSGEADYNIVDDPYPYIYESALKNVGLRVGNLHLSFSHDNTSLTMTYRPGDRYVTFCGVAHGTILLGLCYADPEFAAYCTDSACTDFMNDAFYHFEFTVTTGIVYKNATSAMPTSPYGSVPFVVDEKNVTNSGSERNKGLFYPLGYPEATVHFGLINLTTANFDNIPERWLSVGGAQMYIASGNGTGFGFDGFVGLAGIKVRLDLLPEPSNNTFPDDFNSTSPKAFIMSSVVNGIVDFWPIFGIPSTTRGNGFFMFFVEGSCNKTDTCLLHQNASSYSESSSLSQSHSESDSLSESDTMSQSMSITSSPSDSLSQSNSISTKKTESQSESPEANIAASSSTTVGHVKAVVITTVVCAVVLLICVPLLFLSVKRKAPRDRATEMK